jgi:hypothetical protein
MARTKKTARRVCKAYIPNIENKKIEQDSPRTVYRVNNRIAILYTFEYLYLVDVTQSFKKLKILKDFSKLTKEAKDKHLHDLNSNNISEVAVF